MSQFWRTNLSRTVDLLSRRFPNAADRARERVAVAEASGDDEPEVRSAMQRAADLQTGAADAQRLHTLAADELARIRGAVQSALLAGEDMATLETERDAALVAIERARVRAEDLQAAASAAEQVADAARSRRRSDALLELRGNAKPERDQARAKLAELWKAFEAARESLAVKEAEAGIAVALVDSADAEGWRRTAAEDRAEKCYLEWHIGFGNSDLLPGWITVEGATDESAARGHIVAMVLDSVKSIGVKDRSPPKPPVAPEPAIVPTTDHDASMVSGPILSADLRAAGFAFDTDAVD